MSVFNKELLTYYSECLSTMPAKHLTFSVW